MSPTALGTSYKWNHTIFVIFVSGYCFPQWLHHFTFPPAAHKGSSFSTSSLTLASLCFFWVLKIAILMGVKWSLLVLLISLPKLLFVGERVESNEAWTGCWLWVDQPCLSEANLPTSARSPVSSGACCIKYAWSVKLPSSRIIDAISLHIKSASRYFDARTLSPVNSFSK